MHILRQLRNIIIVALVMAAGFATVQVTANATPVKHHSTDNFIVEARTTCLNTGLGFYGIYGKLDLAVTHTSGTNTWAVSGTGIQQAFAATTAGGNTPSTACTTTSANLAACTNYMAIETIVDGVVSNTNLDTSTPSGHTKTINVSTNLTGLNNHQLSFALRYDFRIGSSCETTLSGEMRSATYPMFT